MLANVPDALKSAKTLSRRLGITYKEIREIVQTGFVNPELTKLSLLYKLGVSIQDVRLYRDEDCQELFDKHKALLNKLKNNDHISLSDEEQKQLDTLSQTDDKTGLSRWEIITELAAFEEKLEKQAQICAKTVEELKKAVEAIPLERILVLADADAGCSFEQTILKYADAQTTAKPIDFLRINLFVRLWRKLGWTIEETDRALQVFVPSNTQFDTHTLGRKPLKTALVYLAHLKSLDGKVKVGKQSRIKLLTLWSDIPTTGKNPLYAQLFLTPSVLKNDPVFDDPLGHYLTDEKEKIKDHLLALQGALGSPGMILMQF